MHDCAVMMQGLAGVACMTYNFSSSAPEASLAVQDGNALLNAVNTGSGPALPYSVCGYNNCTQLKTIPLDANIGVYYINFTGSSTTSSWGAMSYTLHGLNDTGAPHSSSVSQLL